MNPYIDSDSILDRLFEHLESGTTDRAPEIYEVDVNDYTDPDRHALELDTLFRRTPLLVSLSRDVADAGSYKTFEIAGVPILLVRGDDDILRGFFNVCRHRGARLADSVVGCAENFVCRYHAWSYDRQGALRNVPKSNDFGSFERATRNLAELPCEERDGLVWMVLTPGAALDISAHLQGLEPELAGFDFARASAVVTRRLETGNWKLAMNTYMENYHVGILHQKTFGKSTITNTTVLDRYGLHQRSISPRKAIRRAKGRVGVDAPFSVFTLTYTVFPNVVLVVTPELVFIARIIPGKTIGHSITILEFFYLGGTESDEQRRAFEERAEVTVRAIGTEDYPVMDGIQAGLGSNANKTLLFGQNEPALHHFHRQLDLALQAAS